MKTSIGSYLNTIPKKYRTLYLLMSAYDNTMENLNNINPILEQDITPINIPDFITNISSLYEKEINTIIKSMEDDYPISIIEEMDKLTIIPEFVDLPTVKKINDPFAESLGDWGSPISDRYPSSDDE